MCDATAGKVAKSKAIFVIEPVATSQAVLGGQASRASLISRIALQWVSGFRTGTGRSLVPSRPLSPWISGAAFVSLQNGFDAPGKTGMLGRPMASRTLRAFVVVREREAFP